jgi:hypothetical protein
MSADNDIDLKLKNLQEALDASRQALQAGETVDLKGLDKEVGHVCEVITILDKQEGLRYLAKLQKLVDTLDELTTELRLAFESSY